MLCFRVDIGTLELELYRVLCFSVNFTVELRLYRVLCFRVNFGTLQSAVLQSELWNSTVGTLHSVVL